MMKPSLIMLHRFILAMSVASGVFSTSAIAEESRLYKVEAAYLYNFFNYITWPGYASPEALKQPVICFYANDPIEPYLSYMQQKFSSERKLEIRTLPEGGSVGGCNLLFLSHSPDDNVKNTLANDTLTVFGGGTTKDKTSMIVLTQDDERIAMTIDNSQLEQNGFRVSSRLLNLAQQIK